MTHLKLAKLTLYVALCAILSSCSHYPLSNQPATNIIEMPFAVGNKFLPRPIITPPEQILSLSSEHKKALRDYFNQKENRSMLPNKRLAQYLEDYVENYFYFNQTLTANQSLAKSQGNCLSLAILTTAFANHLGIDIGYQLVDSTPVYQEENGIVLSSEHVRSLLYAPKQELQNGISFFSRSAIAIDYFPERNLRVKRQVNKNEFLAMFYRNRAAESLIQKNNILAYWQLRKALELKPNDQHAINMFALVHEYHGLKVHAEALFKYGIERTDDKLNILKNYEIFLQREERFKDAAKITRQLSSYKTKNPFDWIKRGNNSLAQGRHYEAKRYFKRALKLAPYVHQAYFGIAKSETYMGNHKAARRALKKAKENAFELKNKELYQNKLIALKRES
ncbi:MAG: hypothetical protein COA86_13910 [Kangiella sp.]|nr:MAG: hypothetical protein COA86_13910 [Kangiella sp.]